MARFALNQSRLGIESATTKAYATRGKLQSADTADTRQLPCSLPSVQRRTCASAHRDPSRLLVPSIMDDSDAALRLPMRPLGGTGLKVSVLGFGASPLGGTFGAIDEAAGIDAVHHAFRRGINFFDTSPYYGLTKSETVLGRALRDLPRSEVVLSTKVGRYGVDQRDFDFSAKRVTASVAESLERLQVSYIDVIQCHDIEFGDLEQIVHETLPALAALRSQGLIRHVGITGLPLEAFRYVLDRAPPGSVDVVLSYCHYCLNDTTLLGSLPYFRAKGVGIINASPLSMGLLTKGGPPDWHPASPQLRTAAAAAAAHAAARGWDISSLGLGFSLRQPDVSSTLVGMFTRETVDENINTALRALGSTEVAADEAQVLAEVADILAPVRDLTWPSGRPLPGQGRAESPPADA